jgi:hypothetical protein
MSSVLTGFTVKIRTIAAQIFAWPTIMVGMDASGNFWPISTDSSGNIIVNPSSGAATSVKTTGAVTVNGTIPAGTTAVQFLVGPGATVVIDGIPVPAGSGVYYAPASKLHSAITYTVANGTLYYYYEV